MEVRLNKYLKDSGVCSRRKADEFIEKGYVRVNGKVVSELGVKVDPEKDTIEIDDKLLAEKKCFRYILLNKPAGYVTTKSRSEGRSVFELLPDVEGMTYAGRLDKDSEGLLIFSNDGEFIFGITYPEFEKEKEYEVRVDRVVTDDFLSAMRRGVKIEGKVTRPAVVTKTGERSYNIILTEGMNRQIRKMAEKFGYDVTKLRRFRIKNIYIKDLKAGKWRDLTQAEIDSLRRKSL